MWCRCEHGWQTCFVCAAQRRGVPACSLEAQEQNRREAKEREEKKRKVKEEKETEEKRLSMSWSDEHREEEDFFTQYVAEDQASRLQALYKMMEKRRNGKRREETESEGRAGKRRAIRGASRKAAGVSELLCWNRSFALLVGKILLAR